MRMTETGWPTSGSRNFAGHDAGMDMGTRCACVFVCYICVWSAWHE